MRATIIMRVSIIIPCPFLAKPHLCLLILHMSKLGHTVSIKGVNPGGEGMEEMYPPEFLTRGDDMLNIPPPPQIFH